MVPEPAADGRAGAPAGSDAFALPPDSRTFVALRLGQYALLLAVGVVTARALGPAGRAAYIVPLTIVGIVWIVLHLTLHDAIGRLIGRGELNPEDAPRILVTATLALSAIGIVAYAVLFAIGGESFFGGASSATVWLAGASLLPMMAVSYASDLLARLNALRASGLGVLLGGFLQLAGICVLWASGDLTPASAMAMALISLTASTAYLTVALGRLLGIRSLIPTLEATILKPVFAVGAPLHPGTLSIQLGPRVDLLIVAALFSEEDTGLYSLALVLAEAVFLSCRMLSELALPSQTLESEAVAIEGTKQVTRLSAGIGLALGLVGAALAPLLIPFVFGDEWKGAVVPLIALIAASGALGIINPVRQLLARLYVPWRLAAIAVSTLVANIALTVILAGPLDLAGAALASSLAFWGYAIALLVVLRGVHARHGRSIGPLASPEDDLGAIPAQEPLA